jgi:hypothetical protein
LTDNDVVQLIEKCGQYGRHLFPARTETNPVRSGRDGCSVRSLVHGEDLGLVNPAHLELQEMGVSVNAVNTVRSPLTGPKEALKAPENRKIDAKPAIPTP